MKVSKNRNLMREHATSLRITIRIAGRYYNSLNTRMGDLFTT